MVFLGAANPSQNLGSSTFVIGNQLLKVTVASGIDKTPLANHSVAIYQRLADGSRKGFRTVTTDSKGLLNLDLPGLGSSTDYEFKTPPKHGSLAIYSAQIKSTNAFTFNVANTRVKVINGQTNSIVKSHKVVAYKTNSSGKHLWFASSNTDSAGFVDFQLPNVSSSQPYIFKSSSLSDGISWSSKPITKPGSSTFVIGNQLLKVTVASGIDKTPLANHSVAIYQRLADGSRKGFRTVTTDSKGLLNLDLPGLGSSTDYEFKTLPKHGSLAIYSAQIKSTNAFTFNVANTRVKVINGQTNSIVKSHKVVAYKTNSSGKHLWFASSNTDSAGFVDFQLPNVSSSQPYIFKSSSLSDGISWSSKPITKPGSSTFVIGNQLLKVTVASGIDKTPLANIIVTAYIRMPDKSLKSFQKKTSDINGKINFDLQGLGNGTNYVLTSSPYGIKISSNDIINTDPYLFEAGKLEVKLRKKVDRTVIKNQKLYLYEKIAPENLKWRATAITDQKGKVYFDPKGLGTGKIFVIKANNLFGNNQNYFSQWLFSKGRFEFIVDPNDPHKLDEEAPSFKSFLPNNNAILADVGFMLKMQVTDNNKVKNVHIRIIDPIKGTKSGQAVFSNNEWTFSITSNMISKNQTIKVEAEAEDQAGNKSSVNYQYSIIHDLEKPVLTITSHRDGDQIDQNGFLLKGTVVDNTEYVKLLATVIDPINGIVINQKELEIGKNHHWALLATDLSRGEDIVIKLETTDSAFNVTNTQLMLSVMTDNINMIQLINRITFGATPELLKELRGLWCRQFYTTAITS